jgi:hypothetical protein
MIELAPYHYRPEELHSSLQPHILRTAEFPFRGEIYRYGILSRAAAPTIPNFAGMYGGQNLICSEDLIADALLLGVSLGHEVLCKRLNIHNPNHSCMMVENEVLAPFEPHPEILSRIIKARVATFRGLMEFYKINPDQPQDPFRQEITGTWKYLENLARGRQIPFLAANVKTTSCEPHRTSSR